MTTETTNLRAEEHVETPTSLFTLARQEEIRQKVTDLFDNSGMTIQQISRITDISERTLSRYRAGTVKKPDYFTLNTIIVALGGDVKDILGFSSPEHFSPREDPYGDLIASYRNEAITLRSALDNITADLSSLCASIASTKRLITIRTIALLVVISIFCILEIVDLCNPDWGRYQWMTDLFGHYLEKV